MDYNEHRLENRKIDIEKIKIRIKAKKMQLDALKARYEIGELDKDNYSRMLFNLYEDIERLMDKLVSI